MLFPKGEFVIGESEKHTVRFCIDPWWGKFDVWVDEQKTLISGKSILSGPFSIEIGNNRKYTITFQVILAVPFAAFREKHVQVLIDGKHFKTF